jgi:hypothetical protein
MKETGSQAGRFRPCAAIYAVNGIFSRPILARTYSAEVTGFHRNLPHHRRLRPNRRYDIIAEGGYKVKQNLKFL